MRGIPFYRIGRGEIQEGSNCVGDVLSKDGSIKDLGESGAIGSGERSVQKKGRKGKGLIRSTIRVPRAIWLGSIREERVGSFPYQKKTFDY